MIGLKRIYCFISVLLAATGLSQSTIQGIVRDSLDTPIPFATIGIINANDSSLLKGTISDENGNFKFSGIKAGRYFLKCFVVGYNEKVSSIFITDSLPESIRTIDLKLSVGVKNLSDVSVYALKRNVEFKNGNIIVNVEDSPLAKGNSVYDLLLKLPGVSVENNSVIIQGKSGVIVMIDGRPQSMSGVALINLLKGMSADLVKNIEVLRNPPVKYDASGTAGMINIVSKKTGILGWTGTLFSSYSQGFYDRETGGASLNYKAKNLIFFSSITGERGVYQRLENFRKKFAKDTSTMYMNGDNTVKSIVNNLSYKAGVDILISDRDVLGVKVEGNPGMDGSKYIGLNLVTGNNKLGFDHLTSEVNQLDLWNSTNLNLNFEHKLDSIGSNVSAVTDLTTLTETVGSDNTNLFYDVNDIQILSPNIYRSKNVGSSNIMALRVDLTKIITATSSFEAGGKFAQSQTTNHYSFERMQSVNASYTLDTSLVNQFKYAETTYAGYFNYRRSFKKLEMQLGTRIENTYLTSVNSARNFSLSRKYFNVFPNFFFEYKPNDKHDFQLTLSRRIDRPSFSDLNPFKYFNDQYSLNQGNPFLLPDYANRADLTYVSKKGLSISFAYSYVDNTILSYTSQDDSSKVTTQSVKNIVYSDKLGSILSYEKSLRQWWDISWTATISRVGYRGDINGVGFYEKGLSYYSFISNTFLLKGRTKFQVSGMYFGPNFFGIFKIQPRYMISTGITTDFLKEKLQLTFGVDDILYSFIFKNKADYANQSWSFRLKEDSRRFRIAINYKFGRVKVTEREKTSNEEEKGRLNH